MSVVEEFDYRISPESLLPFLRPDGDVVFLDSAFESEVAGRYSYLMSGASILLTGAPGRSIIRFPASNSTAVRELPVDPLDICALVLESCSERVNTGELCPGWAGFVGYDFSAAQHGIKLSSPIHSVPQLRLGWYTAFLTWDHTEKRAWITAHEQRPDLSSNVPVRWLRNRTEKLVGSLRNKISLCARGEEHFESPAPKSEANADTAPVSGEIVERWPAARSSFSRSEYLRAVERVRELILDGDIFQANISQRFTVPYWADPWDLYLALRTESPAFFAAFIEFPEGAILSASPELFLRADKHRHVETRPIKGTRPRGSSAAEDSRLAAELLSSEKDRAENLMIVDLLRNDLSRVCEPGSVHVPALCALERWSNVQHLVSTVRGTLRSDASSVDLFRVCSPGGSITGAPKRRAMEIIAEIEQVGRGVYCGSIGAFGIDGSALMNIAIRTVSVANGVASFAAGGGIVLDSEPLAEFDETLAKASGIFSALSLTKAEDHATVKQS